MFSIDEAKSVLHFKLRVLDLVELYIRKESTNPLVLVGHMTTIIIIYPLTITHLPPFQISGLGGPLIRVNPCCSESKGVFSFGQESFWYLQEQTLSP